MSRFILDPDRPRVSRWCCPVGRCTVLVVTENARCQGHEALTIPCRTCLYWSRHHQKLCNTCYALGWVTPARDNWAAENGAIHDAWVVAPFGSDAPQDVLQARARLAAIQSSTVGAIVDPDDAGEAE